MKDRSHIVWPAVIIALLMFSGLTVVAVMWASRSDGGARVVENYYERSVAWDSIAAARAETDRLGWEARARIDVVDGKAMGIIDFRDLNGDPVVGIVGEVTVSRPHSSSTFGTQLLSQTPGQPGLYRFHFPYEGRGLWDLGIEADRADDHFSKTVRVEV